MTIKIRLMLLTTVSLLITSSVIGVLAIGELNKASKTSITKMLQFGEDEIKRIELNGQKEIKNFRNNLIAQKKEYLKSQIQTAMGVLKKGYEDSHSIESLKEKYREQLHNVVNTAFSILVAVDADPEQRLEQKQQKAMGLIKALRYGPEGKDYFWINDMQARMIMHPYKPELDGKDLSETKDPKGKKLFEAFINICRTDGEGFVDYYWPRYGENEPQPKLSFVKRYASWDWIVGSGVYLEVAENRLKTDSAAMIGALRYGPENKDYFWINDMQCKMVMHPYKPQLNGKDLSEAKDPNGKKLFMEFVRTCRTDGEGFVDYCWPRYGEEKPQPKLSYVKFFKAWDWVVGTGVYTDDIDASVDIKKEAILRRIQAVKADVQAQIEISEKEVTANIARVIIWICIFSAVILVVAIVVSLYFITKSIYVPVKNAVSGVSEASGHVAEASGHVSNASQILAEGASEQAASIEETSSSLEQMATTTKKNCENADLADSLMGETNKVVNDANSSMRELTESMDNISRASQETSKIIKTIDEIAFQTNLLALNAAVEAARAGEAGAGFAVVADEVRNLAMRAATAAKNTADLIEDTVKKIRHGTELVGTTGEAFKEVRRNASQVGELVREIAMASNQQTQGIDQLNTAVGQMNMVIQQNAASAEESASSSEEMSSQAEKMRNIVRQLLALVDTGNSKVREERRN